MAGLAVDAGFSRVDSVAEEDEVREPIDPNPRDAMILGDVVVAKVAAVGLGNGGALSGRRLEVAVRALELLFRVELVAEGDGLGGHRQRKSLLDPLVGNLE
jgi:hypothetical protein